MAVRCSECGGSTSWDDDAASAICTSCGTLTDPSQSILTSDADQGLPYNPSVPSTGLWNPAAPTALKSFRTGQNWNLAGQATKEARDRKNSYAIAGFINSLAHSLNASGLSPRATNIHMQAMGAGRFRWGRKAKLVAGACLAIALREYKRPDSLHDIAFLLDEPFPALARTLTTVVSTLNLPCTISDTSVYIPSLQAHLSSALADATHRLPPALVAQLKLISFRAAANGAVALCALLTRLGPNHRVNSLPGPPTSCAVFLLGLEGEARAPLISIADLAACLAVRCHTSRSVVMERYKLIQDEVSLMIDKVPWLSKHEPKNGRAKVAKRAVVARGLADVIQFQNEIWSKAAKPTVVLETSEGDEDEDELGNPQTSPPAISKDPISPHSSRKRRKTKHNSLYDAAAFLVDPLSAPLPPSALSISHTKLHRSHSRDASSVAATPPINVASSNDSTPRTTTPYLPLTSYILTLPSAVTLSAQRPPTRLQLLLASRHGKEEEITDEELFGDGELEGLLRSEEQVGELRAQFGWREERENTDGEEEGCVDGMEDMSSSEGMRQRVGKRKQRKDKESDHEGCVDIGGGEGAQTRKSRINLQALAEFLENPVDEKDNAGYGYDEAFLGLEALEQEEDGEEEGEFGNKNFASYSEPPRTPPRRPLDAADGEVVVDEWHPLSPEVGRGYRISAAVDYDEEYE